MNSHAAPETDHPVGRRSEPREVRRVVLSSFLGSTIEYYDLILYASAAALVFGPVFFSQLDPVTATIASYLTFAAAYVSRPLGGIVFGHFGDRVGRKKMLMVSMVMMGVVSVLIGFVPAIEIWGAVMLLVLRALQGIAIGGEWGGAALMSLEHADAKHRGFAASFTNAGGPFGAFLGTAALALFAALPEEQFLTWGWRVPFYFSALLLVIGLYVRSRVSESPVFKEVMEQQEERRTLKEKVPMLDILSHPVPLIVVGIGGMGAFIVQAMFSTFGVTYATSQGTASSASLWAFAISQLVATFTIPFFAWISDRIGRRPVMIGGLLAIAVLAFPIYGMLGRGETWSTILAFLLALSVCQSAMFGPMAAYLGEAFGARSRYTGASLGYQLAALLGAGFTPSIVASIYAAQGKDISGVAWYLIVGAVLSALVLLVLARESRHTDIGARKH